MVSSAARTVDGYLDSLPPERRAVVSAVRDVVRRFIASTTPDQFIAADA